MNTQAMIAYLPVDGSWCKQDLPHMTLVYAGETANLQASDFNAMAKDALSAARITGSFSLAVTGVEEFGEDADAVDVLTFHPTPQLLVARQTVEKWNASQFKDYKPHGTIGPAGSAISMMPATSRLTEVAYGDSISKSWLPLNVYFNKICVAWNDDKLIFNLNEVY